MGGSRLLHVRDGDEADLVACLGLLHLPGDRGQGDFVGIDVILGGEHVEIGLRHALHQILLGRLVVRFGLRHLRIGTLEGDPVVPTKQVLLKVQRVVMGRGFDRAVERKGLEDGVGTAGRGAGDAFGGARRCTNGQADRLGGVLRTLVALPGNGAVGGELRQQCGECLGL
jgi:hypothetical protein